MNKIFQSIQNLYLEQRCLNSSNMPECLGDLSRAESLTWSSGGWDGTESVPARSQERGDAAGPHFQKLDPETKAVVK